VRSFAFAALDRLGVAIGGMGERGRLLLDMASRRVGAGRRPADGMLACSVCGRACFAMTGEGAFSGKLVGPARRRRAVAMLRDHLGLSERWACRVVGQLRSTERCEPQRVPRPKLPWWTGRKVRFAALLVCLTALVVYALSMHDGGVLGSGANPSSSPSSGEWAPGCPARKAPAVASVSSRRLAVLRDEARKVFHGGYGRLYALGGITSEDAWSDESPQEGAASLPEGVHVPGAYELRWWAPNGDDIVADVFMFAQTRQARQFFELAASADCRPKGAQMPVSSPRDARDLVWLNPDRVVQQDVYLLRGNRVYRVGDVRAAGSRIVPHADQRIAFSIVNGLACALPEAGCGAGGRQYRLAIVRVAR
jgi:hypothetical protein